MKQVIEIDKGIYQVDYGKFAYVVTAKNLKEAIKIANGYYKSRGKILLTITKGANNE